MNTTNKGCSKNEKNTLVKQQSLLEYVGWS